MNTHQVPATAANGRKFGFANDGPYAVGYSCCRVSIEGEIECKDVEWFIT